MAILLLIYCTICCKSILKTNNRLRSRIPIPIPILFKTEKSRPLGEVRDIRFSLSILLKKYWIYIVLSHEVLGIVFLWLSDILSANAIDEGIIVLCFLMFQNRRFRFYRRGSRNYVLPQIAVPEYMFNNILRLRNIHFEKRKLYYYRHMVFTYASL